MAVRWRAKVEHLLFRNNCLHIKKKMTQKKMANLTIYRRFNGRIISRWSCSFWAVLRSGTLCSLLSGSFKDVLARGEKDGKLSCLTVSSIQLQSQCGLRFFSSSQGFPTCCFPVSCISTLTSLSCCHGSACGLNQCHVSIRYDVVPLRDPILLNTGNNLEVLILLSLRKLEFTKATDLVRKPQTWGGTGIQMFLVWPEVRVVFKTLW